MIFESLYSGRQVSGNYYLGYKPDSFKEEEQFGTEKELVCAGLGAIPSRSGCLRQRHPTEFKGDFRRGWRQDPSVWCSHSDAETSYRGAPSIR